ncbi:MULTISPECIES: hypothetical protein [Candidatus Cardinium]|uniref:hypothetical protein n=1 Tax=Candidatus Cardinium TaxID=273135 RepID=UPI001FAAC0C4|nr:MULTISPECIES: hypothetical protein [Cardinium]
MIEAAKLLDGFICPRTILFKSLLQSPNIVLNDKDKDGFTAVELIKKWPQNYTCSEDIIRLLEEKINAAPSRKRKIDQIEKDHSNKKHKIGNQ